MSVFSCAYPGVSPPTGSPAAGLAANATRRSLRSNVGFAYFPEEAAFSRIPLPPRHARASVAAACPGVRWNAQACDARCRPVGYNPRSSAGPGTVAELASGEAITAAIRTGLEMCKDAINRSLDALSMAIRQFRPRGRVLSLAPQYGDLSRRAAPVAQSADRSVPALLKPARPTGRSPMLPSVCAFAAAYLAVPAPPSIRADLVQTNPAAAAAWPAARDQGLLRAGSSAGPPVPTWTGSHSAIPSRSVTRPAGVVSSPMRSSLGRTLELSAPLPSA